jgi:hypothetical protein
MGPFVVQYDSENEFYQVFDYEQEKNIKWEIEE